MIANSDRLVSAFGRAVLDRDELPNVVAKAVRDGFAVVLCKPGSKVPVCTLTTPTARSRADKAAKEAARAAGVEHWDRVRHDCGLKHALTDPDKARAIVKKVQAQWDEPLNLAIEPRASRMVCVDVDDDDQLFAFLDSWSQKINANQYGHELTVQSPGVLRNGQWLHKDGGHFWFTMPEGVELPTASGKWKSPDGWAVLWGESYALVPPSARAEGPYVFKSPEIEPVPGWLIELISNGAGKGLDGPVSGPKPAGDPVDVWAAETPWAMILDSFEDPPWTPTGRLDACGCPIWTAPGGRADPKSATAHESGCRHTDTSTGHGPLHLWTDAPPAFLEGRRNVTKLQYLALRHHGGNMAAAMISQGIKPELAAVDELEPWGETEEQEPWSRIIDLGPYIDGTIVNPQPCIGARRNDGVASLYPTKWHTVIGLTTAGKSWLALWHALAVIEQGGSVVYVHFEEQTPTNTITRLRQLGADMEVVKSSFHWMSNEKSWRAGEMAFWLDRADLRPELVVLDGINAACSQQGWKVNDTEAVGLYRGMFVNPAKARGAAVLSLGHPVKDRTRQDEIHSFGSTAWLDEVDGCSIRMVAAEAPIRRKHRGSSAVSVVKDRAGEVAALCQLNTEKSEPWYYLGQFRVDDSGPVELEGEHRTVISLDAPSGVEDDRPGRDRIDQLGEKILEILRARGGRYETTRQLKGWLIGAGVKPGNDNLDPALDRLEDAGLIKRGLYIRGQARPGWVSE